MPLDFARARPLLQSGDFARLFREELGWENAAQRIPFRVEGQDIVLTAFAEKRGFTAWLCECADGGLPLHGTRLKIDRALTETSFEHLIVFATPSRDRQSWMWVRREAGKPVAPRTHEYFVDQPGESLLQKLDALYISFEDEEAGLNIAQVAGRARAAFDVERVTKQFYRDFDTHRKAFVKFIDGIGVVADREWYASVMLNRLMFVYFIQRKGFLDGDRDYLSHRLKRCQQEQGRDKFYSFYRYFLLRLFHEGFGRRRSERSTDFEKLLGRIPYLNGGLFDVHELERPERYGKAIEISDSAFKRIFDFFDTWEWHLDERPLRKDDEINPDVLGYIFEKYINQKQMGAYYTKEDITDYIGKNTILPFLLDAARAKCKVAFDNPGGPTVWSLLRENPDRYIYAPVRHGTDRPLPAEIEKGIDTAKPNLLERRAGWNRPALAEYALPTEIWREVVARRQRCTELRRKLAAGEVHEVSDLITLNLDIRQFVQDVVAQCEGPDLLRALWHALEKVTVLDPTCGSGAFLFAALNLLEPLYDACLDRMEAFVGDLDRTGEKHRPEKFADFRAVLARVAAHPNRRYFIFKSIILQNLYGVDIMEEAVEICKLRLFLKLAAQVSPDATKDNLGIEPLPDIDFNIRAGNTLVGYATYDEVRKAVLGDQQATMDFDNAMEKIAAKAGDLQQTFDAFRQRQTEGDGSVPAAHKQELQKRLTALRDELNRYLATDYGVNVRDKSAVAKWNASHQPFHWFVEYYGTLCCGGFDVIVGNPPYVETSDIVGHYSIRNLSLAGTGNLYAICAERFINLLREKGRLGIIIPISSVSTPRMLPLMQMLNGNLGPLHLSNFAVRPGKLFVGVDMNLTIVVGQRLMSPTTAAVFSTAYNRWAERARDSLFQNLSYARSALVGGSSAIMKTGTTVAHRIHGRVARLKDLRRVRAGTTSSEKLFYHSGGRYFRKCIRDQLSNEYKELSVRSGVGNAVICLLSSSFYYWFWITISDCYHVTKRDVDTFPVPDSLLEDRATIRLADELLEDLWRHSEKRTRNRADGSQSKEVNFHVGESKPILDQIDAVLARHYGFSDEELDFIINYDIKYRLGRDPETGEE